jgi:hypothetical protein
VDDRPDPVTRLGPDSGGRTPGDPRVRIHTWEWGSGEWGPERWEPGAGRRPGLPWIGVFLLVFGGLLLLQQLYPEARSLGSLFVLAVGLAFLIRWGMTRGTGSLYAGAIITALAVPGALTNAGLAQEGLGTFAFGIAFLFIAAVRYLSGGGVGWQAWFGGLLALLGGVNLVTPQVGGLIVPVALVGLGLALVFGGSIRGFGGRP